MVRSALSVALMAVVWANASAIAGGDADEVSFEGYSPRAQATVEALIKAIGEVSTYSDNTIFKMETGMSFAQAGQTASFKWAKGRRFRIRSEQSDVLSDGKRLTVYHKNMRRYTVEPLEKDVGKQVRHYFGGMGSSFSIAGLLLAKDKRKYFAKAFKELDVTGRDTIDGDRCLLLEGTTDSSMMGLSDESTPVVLWLRESDHMIRRVEFDLLEAMKKRFDDNQGMVMPFTEYKWVYDVRDLKIDEPIEESEFAFKAPSGAKKVDRFYSTMAQSGDTAVQFELSGKRAPDFELESTTGEWITLSSLEGNVVVLFFLPSFWPANQTSLFKPLEEVRRDYAERSVSFFCVVSQSEANKLVESLQEAEMDLTVLLDPQRSTSAEFYDEAMGVGVVLVDKKGVVQGHYPGPLRKETASSLRSDLDKLLAGETLPGGEPMTQEQIAEADEQLAAGFSWGKTADPVNEEDLAEAWSVRARSNRSFGFGGGRPGPIGRDMWIRSKNVIRRIEPDGTVTGEISLPNPSTEQFTQDQFVAGQLGGRMGVVYLATIPGEKQSMGWRPPKGATITAADESGEELWQIELEVSSNQQLPAHLTLADIDGRRGDELLFVHENSISIVGGDGELLVRRPISGNVQWMIVEDRDRDRRAEIYVRTVHKLFRYDYRPKR